MPQVLDYYQRRMVPARAEPAMVIDLHERRQAAARMTTAATDPEESNAYRTDWTRPSGDVMLWWMMWASGVSASTLATVSFVGACGRRLGWW